MKTDYNDRSGKPIYLGDIVQYRLSLQSGPSLLKVAQFKGRIRLVHPESNSGKGGLALGKQLEKYVVIIDTTGRMKE